MGKKYRKYKPRTQPGKCNVCGQKNIMAAYHTICTKCAGSEKEIMAMLERYLGSDRQHDESNPAHEPSASCAASPCSSVKATPSRCGGYEYAPCARTSRRSQSTRTPARKIWRSLRSCRGWRIWSRTACTRTDTG